MLPLVPCLVLSSRPRVAPEPLAVDARVPMKEADDQDPAKPGATPRPKAGASQQARRPLVGEVDEEAVDAPSRQTLLMLGVICAATLIMWAAGRAACNYYVPGESLTPREVSVGERTRFPKGVAVEFAQAMAGGDFQVAKELAAEDAIVHVAQKDKECGACEQRRAARDQLLSVAVVLDATAMDSVVRVETTGAPQGSEERLLRIQRSRKEGWKVTQVLQPGQEVPELDEPPVDSLPPQVVRRAPLEHSPAPGTPAQPGAPAPGAPAQPGAPAKSRGEADSR